MRKSQFLTAALAALLSTSACEQKYEIAKVTPKTESQTNPDGSISVTENFTVKSTSQGTKVDILFVIDNSGSMAEEQAALKNAFSSFITKFVERNIDYHIGITSTDSRSYYNSAYGNVVISSTSNPYYGYWNPFPQSTSTPGTLLMRGTYSANPKFISPTSGSNQQVVDMFKANAGLGTNGNGNERVIYDALLTLDPSKLSNENANFRRNDALLSVIGVTDENEEIASDSVSYNGKYVGTETTPQQRIDRFKNYMPVICGTSCPGWKVDLIVDLNAAYHETTYPLVPYANVDPNTGKGTTNPYPDFYKKFAAQTGSALTNIYDSNWGANLANIATSIITAAENQFKLSVAPVVSSIKVSLNGVPVANDAANGYVYVASAQAIELRGSTLAGAAGKTLKVTYTKQ